MIDKDYLTTHEVAALLDVEPATIRAYAKRRQMPTPNVCPCCGLGPVWSRYIIEAWRRERANRSKRA